MKEYLIWLKSGACIIGEMEPEEVERLKNEYKFDSYSTSVREFKDKEGILLITFSTIHAISINDKEETKENNKVGF
jgi:hypothetical protein